MMMLREGWSWRDELPFELHMHRREIICGILFGTIACLMSLGGLVMLIRSCSALCSLR